MLEQLPRAGQSPRGGRGGHRGAAQYGAGTASVRFICGTFDCHRAIEQAIARFAQTPAALTYVSCWNANEALFPTVAEENDVILSDELNHASIIDGCRLVRKAERGVYKHKDMADLEDKLKQHSGKAVRWVVTDGVFSMEGDVADLPGLIDLCKRYEAILVVDDSHGVGVLGTRPGDAGALRRARQVDVVTGTLGKAPGRGGRRVRGGPAARHRAAGAAQPAEPVLQGAAGHRGVQRRQGHRDRRTRAAARGQAPRQRPPHARGTAKLGFECTESPTAIIPIMIGDTAAAIAKSKRLLELGVLVIGFGFPVVPQGKARLRVQVSAALEPEHIDGAGRVRETVIVPASWVGW